jgi:hypothetical protein
MWIRIYSVARHHEIPYVRIVVFVDAFSRLVTLIPVHTLDAEDAVLVFRQIFSESNNGEVNCGLWNIVQQGGL